jgi:hypothetical protein
MNPWDLDNIKREFQWCLEGNKGEVVEDQTEGDFYARFNLARLIFLERQL